MRKNNFPTLKVLNIYDYYRSHNSYGPSNVLHDDTIASSSMASTPATESIIKIHLNALCERNFSPQECSRE
jgi:hypothetical protein